MGCKRLHSSQDDSSVHSLLNCNQEFRAEEKKSRRSAVCSQIVSPLVVEQTALVKHGITLISEESPH
ncbi:hypothetical protein CEXT_774731 [Caerostris extrusa]|uniref:Uncharacterized protein n=1 Tax=Caerostris extrusa TaxID=172846 RepID=A0AAV4VL20_CAEEX|nr:hypothetical protein CEXT_774731 [Caerostris extrusa]